MNESLGHLLKRYRLNCGYSQQAMANALGVDRSTYSYYETKKSMPTIKTISILKKMLNIPYDEIFSCFEQENKETESAMENVIPFDRDFPDRVSVYELPRDEKQLILFYRSLNVENRKNLMSELQELAKTNR